MSSLTPRARLNVISDAARAQDGHRGFGHGTAADQIIDVRHRLKHLFNKQDLLLKTSVSIKGLNDVARTVSNGLLKPGFHERNPPRPLGPRKPRDSHWGAARWVALGYRAGSEGSTHLR